MVPAAPGLTSWKRLTALACTSVSSLTTDCWLSGPASARNRADAVPAAACAGWFLEMTITGLVAFWDSCAACAAVSGSKPGAEAGADAAADAIAV